MNACFLIKITIKAVSIRPVDLLTGVGTRSVDEPSINENSEPSQPSIISQGPQKLATEPFPLNCSEHHCGRFSYHVF